LSQLTTQSPPSVPRPPPYFYAPNTLLLRSTPLEHDVS
jgi:hypothetical protein